MKLKIALLTGALAFTSPALMADGPAQPEKMSKADIAGDLFTRRTPVVHHYTSEIGPYDTQDVETFLSSDRQFDTGMYRSGPVKETYTEPYGVHEFMYFIEGGVTLTSADGTVTEIKAGDAVTIPKEWLGTWESQGYLKIYVIYSPDTPISE